ncbi:MAG: hypothetical protein P1U81_06875 [Verrucomicrobiales bacterium]|nr:hypothetical protein [Verrucomicrobiales bacterium]
MRSPLPFCFTTLVFISPVLAIEFEADILPIFASKCTNCHLEGI